MDDQTHHASGVYLTLDAAPRALKPRALLSRPVWDYFLDIEIHRLRLDPKSLELSRLPSPGQNATAPGEPLQRGYLWKGDAQ